MSNYKRALILVFGAIATLLFSQFVSAADWDISRSHRAAIKELLQQMGTYRIISSSVERGLIQTAKGDAKKAARMKKLANTLDQEKLDATLIPLYAYYYSKKDAKEITKFFGSNTGKLVIDSARSKVVDGKQIKIKLTPAQDLEVRKFFNSEAGRAFKRNRKFINQELKYRIGIMTTRLMYEYIYPR